MKPISLMLRRTAKHISVPILLLIVASGYAGDRAPLAQDRDSESFAISVDVDLVVLHATVTDRQGGFVSDLAKADFQVFENGVLQSIKVFSSEDVPVTVGLVVDHSTTMLRKIADVTAAARGFVQSSNPEDEMFVVNFNDNAWLGLPVAIRFTDDTAALERAIATARTGGQTALYDAIARALEQLQAGSRDKKVLLVVSDGGDNVSKHSLGQIMQMAGQSSAVIYTLGIFDQDDPDSNPGVLKRLAQATGGEAFFPSQLSDAVAICDRIARDIRHQYTIGYIPGNRNRDGAYRAIRVLASGRGQGRLSVRTRTGYLAGGERRLDEKGAK